MPLRYALTVALAVLGVTCLAIAAMAALEGAPPVRFGPWLVAGVLFTVVAVIRFRAWPRIKRDLTSDLVIPVEDPDHPGVWRG